MFLLSRLFSQLVSRLLLAAALTVWLAAPARAQASVDPSGHWEGAIDAQGSELRFELDLMHGDKGSLQGTVNVPSEHLKGIRLQKVAVEGRTIGFYARRDQPFGGSLSTDGRSMTGEYSVEGFSMPFSLTRTGDAVVEPPLTSRPITQALEGSWSGTLQGSGLSLRITLTMTNQPDGTAIGRVVNLDEGGIEIPVVITQDDARVTLQAGIGSFSGVLNTGGTELSGTWSQGDASLPLLFRRDNR
jgi:hypothetical protein